MGKSNAPWEAALGNASRFRSGHGTNRAWMVSESLRRPAVPGVGVA